MSLLTWSSTSSGWSSSKSVPSTLCTSSLDNADLVEPEVCHHRVSRAQLELSHHSVLVPAHYGENVLTGSLKDAVRVAAVEGIDEHSRQSKWHLLWVAHSLHGRLE